MEKRSLGYKRHAEEEKEEGVYPNQAQLNDPNNCNDIEYEREKLQTGFN